MKPEEIDREAFESELYTAGLPDVDLLIRTSGEMRLSNFLLYQLAYAEFYQTDTLWPDFDRHAYDEALLAYCEREIAGLAAYKKEGFYENSPDYRGCRRAVSHLYAGCARLVRGACDRRC